jgi:hypothetical protein
MTVDAAELAQRVANALNLAEEYGQVDGAHHKMWVIDKMVRELLGEPDAYEAWVSLYCGAADGEGEYEYSWDTGIAP